MTLAADDDALTVAELRCFDGQQAPPLAQAAMGQQRADGRERRRYDQLRAFGGSAGTRGESSEGAATFRVAPRDQRRGGKSGSGSGGGEAIEAIEECSESDDE